MNSAILDYQQDANLNLDNILNEVKTNKQYGDIKWNYDNNSKEKSQHEKILIEQIERKLIENNEAFSRYPSDYIHCLMSLDSFFEHFKGTTRVFNNENWKILDQFSEYASNQTRDKLYSAYLYVNDEKQQLVLAYSGTIFNIPALFQINTTLNNQIESVILNQIIPQLVKCYEMTLQANKIAKSKNYYLSFTGYSNGGWLAEYSYYFSIRYFDNFKTKAVLFDGPGIIQNANDNFFNTSSYFDNEFDPQNFNIVNYLTTPHFSNSINKHNGTTYRIFLDDKKNQDMKRAFFDSIKNKFPQIYNCLITSRFFLEGLLSILDFKRLELIKDLFDPITGVPDYYEKMSKFPMIRVKFSDSFQESFRNISKQPIKTLVQLIPLSNLIKSPACFILEQLFFNISDGLMKNMAPGIHVFAAILTQLINENVNLNKFDVPLFEKKVSSNTYPEKEENLNQNFNLLKIANKDDVYLDIKNQCSLLLSSFYETDPYSDKYKSKLNIKNDLKNIDWCLNRLKQTNLDPDKPSKLANFQLNKLKSYYTIKSGNEKDVKILYSNTITADMLKERMLRLISLHPNIRDLLSNSYAEPYHNRIGHKLNQRLDPFIDRENLLEKMTEILSMKEHNLVVLSGPSGNGKSCLANEYAHRVKDAVSNITIRWFNCESRDKINSEYLILAKQLQLNEIENVKMDDLIKQVNSKLQDSTSFKMNYLFILDNVNNFKMINEIFLQNLSMRKFKFVIITENSSDFSKELILNVDYFNLDEAREYVTKYSKQNLNEAQIRYLINSLTTNLHNGIQPLKLNLIVKYMNKNSTASFDSIYSKIHEDKLNTSYRKIFEDLNPQVSNFLSYLGYLDGDSISFELLKKIYLKNSYTLSFDQILDILANHGLIEMNFDQQSIKIHKIIQNEISKYLHSSSTNVFKNMVNILNEHFESSSNSYDYIHLIKIQKTQQQSNDFELLKLKHKLANYHLNSLSEYEKSLKLNLEVNEWFHNHNQNYNHMYSKELSTSYSSISQIYTRLEDYRKALDYSLKSHQIKMNLYDQIELHPDLAQSYTNSGSIYSKLNMDQEAVNCDQRAFNIRSGLYENMDHRELASTLNNLGVSYSRIDEAKSFEYRMKAYEMQSRIFKQKNGNQQNDHHDLAIGLKNMGLFYLKKGDYQRALKSLQESYDMSYRLYKSRDHSELANLLNNLGTCHEHLNHLEDAYKYYMKSFDMRSRLFNNNMNHPDLIESKYLIDKINAKRRLIEKNNQNNVNNFILQCDKCFRVIQDKEELFTCSICDDFHMCMGCYSKLNKRSDSELNHQMYHPLIKFNKQDFLRQNWFEVWYQNFKFENLIKKSTTADSALRINRICSYCRENISGDLYIKYDQSTCSCVECWIKNNRNKIVYQPVELITSRFNNSVNKETTIIIPKMVGNSSYLRLYCDKCDKEILNNTLYSCTICNNYHMCTECFDTVRVGSDGHEKFHPLIQFNHNQNLLQSKRWKNIWSDNFKLETLLQKNLKNVVNNSNKSEYCSFCNDSIDALAIKFGFGLKSSCMNCWIKYRNSSRMIEPVEISFNGTNSTTNSNSNIVNINKNKTVTFSNNLTDESYLEKATDNQSSRIVYTNIQSF